MLAGGVPVCTPLRQAHVTYPESGLGAADSGNSMPGVGFLADTGVYDSAAV